MTVTAHQADLESMPDGTGLPTNSDRHLAPRLMRCDTNNRQIHPQLPSAPIRPSVKQLASGLLSGVFRGK